MIVVRRRYLGGIEVVPVPLKLNDKLRILYWSLYYRLTLKETA